MQLNQAPRALQIAVIWLISLILLAPFASAASVQFAPGVKSSQWASYAESIAVTNRNLLQDILGASMLGGPDSSTISSSLNITSASPDSSNVTFSTTAHYLNSSLAHPLLPSAQTWIDLSVGMGTNEPPFIIARGLSFGRLIGNSTPLILNQTFAQSFNLTVVGSTYTVRVSRYVNQLTFNSSIYYSDGSNSPLLVRYTWDQATGAPLSIFVGTVDLNPPASYHYSLVMTSTNMWPYALPLAPPGLTVNPQPGNANQGLLFGLHFGELYILIGAAVAVAVGVVGVVLRRSAARPNGRSIESRQKKQPTRRLAQAKDKRSKKLYE